MRSSTGAHYLGLDHVRALAAFMVVCSHFCHQQYPGYVPYSNAPLVFPLALLDEGHTGVALFMTLSGYLFTKILEGKELDFPVFLRNRALRLLPMLFAVIAINVLGLIVLGRPLQPLLGDLATGWLLPTLPNGGWSVTVEAHFYLMLPILLWMMRKDIRLVCAALLLSTLIRAAIYASDHEVYNFAYWTIGGRIDQFLLGMAAAASKTFMKQKHKAALSAFIAFCAFYWVFDFMGGKDSPALQASPLWIVMPMIEGAAYATFIAYYDQNFQPANKGWSWFLGKAGQYSYSIYLLHFFFVNETARLVHENLISISNFYLAVFATIPFFLLMMGLGHISFKFIEAPLLARRKSYLLKAQRKNAERETLTSAINAGATQTNG